MVLAIISSGGSRGGARLLFLDKTEAQRAKKHFLRPSPTPPPPPPTPPLLSEGLDPSLISLLYLSGRASGVVTRRS